MVLDTQSLPPTARDFEVYELIHVAGLSTRQAAAHVQISQTRVCQIVKKVAQYLVQTLPDVEPAESKEAERKLLRPAMHVAAARIDHLYGLALQSFAASQGAQVVCREVATELPGSATVITTRHSQGDCRYLLAAARLAIVGSKLPPSCITNGWFQQPADEEPETSRAADPPVGECSVLVLNSGNPTSDQPGNGDASLCTDGTCHEFKGTEFEGIGGNLPPVHLVEPGSGDRPPTPQKTGNNSAAEHRTFI